MLIIFRFLNDMLIEKMCTHLPLYAPRQLIQSIFRLYPIAIPVYAYFSNVGIRRLFGIFSRLKSDGRA